MLPAERPLPVIFVISCFSCIEWLTGKPENHAGGDTMPTFFNQATLSFNDTIINSNITTGELLEVLSVTKTAVTDTYGQGSIVTYVVSIVNTGTTAYTGLTVTDDLGTYTQGEQPLTPLTLIPDSVRYYAGGVLQPTPTVTAGPPVAISPITIPAGSNATIIYSTTVNQFAPLGTDSTIDNTVTVTGGGITPLTATETIRAESAPSLTISKSICPPVVTENGQVTYTFVIQNSGNTEVVATDDAIVTDIFNPILSDLTVTYNGTLWTEGTNYTYDEATGTFTTLPGQITVPAADYTQDPETGVFTIQPGVAVITVTGTV